MRQGVLKAFDSVCQEEEAVGIRWDRIREIRAAIKRGDYETPEKLKVVTDRLLEVLGE